MVKDGPHQLSMVVDKIDGAFHDELLVKDDIIESSLPTPGVMIARWLWLIMAVDGWSSSICF